MKHLLSKVVFTVLLLGYGLAFAKPSVAVVSSVTPTEAIKDLDKQADQYKIGKHLTSADIEFNRKLKERILKGTFDLRELAQQALDKYWNQRTPKEQDQFVELLTNLLQERSLFSKEKAAEKGQAKGYTVQYLGDTYLNKNKTDALSKTRVRVNKRNLKVALDYKLKKIGAGWKIYDVIMDGASLVDNYRYSFGSIINKKGYDELIRRMQKKLAEFRGKRAA